MLRFYCYIGLLERDEVRCRLFSSCLRWLARSFSSFLLSDCIFEKYADFKFWSVSMLDCLVALIPPVLCTYLPLPVGLHPVSMWLAFLCCLFPWSWSLNNLAAYLFAAMLSVEFFTTALAAWFRLSFPDPDLSVLRTAASRAPIELTFFLSALRYSAAKWVFFKML